MMIITITMIIIETEITITINNEITAIHMMVIYTVVEVVLQWTTALVAVAATAAHMMVIRCRRRGIHADGGSEIWCGHRLSDGKELKVDFVHAFIKVFTRLLTLNSMDCVLIYIKVLCLVERLCAEAFGRWLVLDR